MELLNIMLVTTFAVFGLLIGSFLNVCIYRIPAKKFWTDSRSYCPRCGTTLKWYELIPIFSWVFLRGKCRTCKEKISFRYPLIELLTGIIYAATYLRWGLSVQTAVYAVFFSVLIVVSMIDIDTMEIPDGAHIFILILAAASFIPGVDNIVWWHKLIGLAAVSVPFLIIALIFDGGIGGGDIKLMGAAGLLLGFKVILIGAFIGLIIGSIQALIVMIVRKKKQESGRHIPFGPALALGSVIAAFAADEILAVYMGLFGL